MLNSLTQDQFDVVKDVFSYHAPDEEDIAKYSAIRVQGRFLAETVLKCCPPSADRSAAIRKIREAVATANMSVALKGRGI
jgi:hypothetical protein